MAECQHDGPLLQSTCAFLVPVISIGRYPTTYSVTVSVVPPDVQIHSSGTYS